MRPHHMLLCGAVLCSTPLAGSIHAQASRGAEPTVGFKLPQDYVLEHAGGYRVTLELSAPATRVVSVPFSIGGTATEGVDFSIDTPSPVIIPAGQRHAAIVVTLLDDEDNESLETIELVLGTPSGPASLGGELTAHTVGVRDFMPGDPIEGLTPEERESFARGLIQFERVFTPDDGLGPFYDSTSCRSCHSKPSTGGAAALYRNFPLAVYYEGSPANQSSSIPPFISQVVPAFGPGVHTHAASGEFSLEGGRPLLPDMVDFGTFQLPVITAQRNALPVFGTGLFEFISNATIISNSDPNDANQDGISGRTNSQFNGALGRFGTKAQANNLEGFTRAPLNAHLGITTDPLDGLGAVVGLPMAAAQTSVDPVAPTTDNDGVPDPEMHPDDLRDLITFMRFLAPPVPKIFNDAARRGEQLFAQIGCTGCHIPSLPSSRGPVNAYTDLLIHDMGPELADNIKLGISLFSINDFRTQPLWGVSEVGPHLHDGRAETVEEAILLHGGEAAAARAAFVALTDAERDDVITFLEHL